jgi:hypothetical protein
MEGSAKAGTNTTMVNSATIRITTQSYRSPARAGMVEFKLILHVVDSCILALRAVDLGVSIVQWFAREDSTLRGRIAVDQFSGFVPIRFRVAGKLLLGLSSLGFILTIVSRMTGWFALPAVVGMSSLILLLIGLYMFYLASRESEGR